MYYIFFDLSSFFTTFFNIYYKKDKMIKGLVKKYLLEYITEADPMGHFNDRVSEVVEDIIDITIPDNIYIQGVSKETQKSWIISQIQQELKEKINAVIATDFPIGKKNSTGICVLVPLGMIKVQPVKGNPVTAIVTAKRKEDIRVGVSYYIGIYDNRMPSIVLADPKIAANKSPHLQLQAHMYNNINSGWQVNKEKSYVDKSFMSNIVVNMNEFKIDKPKTEDLPIQNPDTTV